MLTTEKIDKFAKGTKTIGSSLLFLVLNALVMYGYIEVESKEAVIASMSAIYSGVVMFLRAIMSDKKIGAKDE